MFMNKSRVFALGCAVLMGFCVRGAEIDLSHTYKIKNATIELVFGDITQQDVQAVVNAAKPELTGGGGVDGAMHRAAGPALVQHILKTIPADENGERCPTGQARVTPGFNLKAPYIIHTV